MKNLRAQGDPESRFQALDGINGRSQPVASFRHKKDLIHKENRKMGIMSVTVGNLAVAMYSGNHQAAVIWLQFDSVNTLMALWNGKFDISES
jgi:hypothetical protein